MKIAQCTYTQAGVEIVLNLYFDSKAFEFIHPVMSREQEDGFLRLACDSIAAALPRGKIEKHLYIKRIFKQLDTEHLRIFCTDGFLIDNALSIPLSPQAYSSERVKLSETDQLPILLKLSNDLLKSMNERLPSFEEEAIKSAFHEKAVVLKETTKQSQSSVVTREFNTEKSLDVLSAITQLKKEIRDLAESNVKTLKDQMAKLNESDAQNQRDKLTQKINEIVPINEKFSAEVEETIKRISQQTNRLTLFKQQVIDALYQSAKNFHALVLPKMEGAALHPKKILQADFNKKFAGIASLSETGALSNLQEARKNLEKLSLENLQEIISDDSKETPGLLQKCNTSWTEESPELQIVMKQLSQLNKTLPELFNDIPGTANKEMIKIIRTPFPRSFQFKFSEAAINYKQVVDDFCKNQKDLLMNQANQYKKILQINDLGNRPQQTSVKTVKNGSDNELKKRKEVSDTILSLGIKEHKVTENYRKTVNQLYEFITTKLDSSLKPLIEKMNIGIEKIRTEVAHADTLMQELTEIKSQIDIQINHHILHPDETPDLNVLDQRILSLGEKRNLLMTKNKLLQNISHKLETYNSIIKQIQEIDLLATKTAMNKQRMEAKEFLLQFMQKMNLDPVSLESLKSPLLEQYSKIDTNVSDIDKILVEVASMQNALFIDMDAEANIPAEKLETRFQKITEKMQVLTSAMGTLNENVSSLKKISMETEK